MPAPLIAAAALAPAVGGLLGNLFSSSDRDKAQSYSRQALEAITGLSLPTVEEQKIALEQLKSQGELSPEMLEVITQVDTELNNVEVDPRLKDAQMSALSSLSKLGEEGLTASDRVALNTVRRDVNRDVEGRNEAILQNMAQRGMGGSGAELAAQLMNSQEGADRASQESDRLAAMANERALQATMNAANLGGQIRSQDYSEKSAAAQAQDAINRFNAANSQSVAQFNVGNKNDAQKFNLTEKQRIADANTNLRNQQEVHNKGLIGADADRRMQKAGMTSNAYTGAANVANNQAASTAGMWTGIGQGVGQAAASGAQYQVNQANSDRQYALDKEKLDLERHKAGVKGYAQGGMVETDLPLLKYMHGGEVEGEAIYKGDHPDNDIVPAVLSPGEIVVPRSIAASSDEAILDFIRHVKKASKRG